MKQIQIAVKRCFLSISFPLMLALIVLALLLTASLGKMPEQRPAAVIDLDQTPLSQRITRELVKNGFVICQEKETLYEKVEAAEWDCGVILPEGLSVQVERLSLNQVLPFVTSAQSMTEELYRGHVSACLFSEAAPYITAKALEETSISKDEVLSTYHAMLQDGYAFSFELKTEEGTLLPQNTKATSLLTGVLAVLIFSVVSVTAISLVHNDMRRMSKRIGFWNSFSLVLLPNLFVRLLLICIAIAVGLVLTEPLTLNVTESSFLLPVCVYVLLIAAVFVLIALLCPDTRVLYFLLFMLLIASVVICPIYIDVLVLSPIFKIVRGFLPIYWMWMLV